MRAGSALRICDGRCCKPSAATYDLPRTCAAADVGRPIGRRQSSDRPTKVGYSANRGWPGYLMLYCIPAMAYALHRHAYSISRFRSGDSPSRLTYAIGDELCRFVK